MTKPVSTSVYTAIHLTLISDVADHNLEHNLGFWVFDIDLGASTGGEVPGVAHPRGGARDRAKGDHTVRILRSYFWQVQFSVCRNVGK